MKKATLVLCSLLLCFSLSAQKEREKPKLKLSIQTDLAAYTSLGGFSVWGVAQLQQNKLAIAFTNYPNRCKRIYQATGIKETDRFLRLQLTRYFKPTSVLRNFFYGINAEYHWRELKEDNNSNEILGDTHWKIGVVIGYEWHPWYKKENALKNLSIIPWVGINYAPSYNTPVRVFENTGNVYGLVSTTVVNIPFGLNLNYTFFNK
jgi:hypothetical protein